MGRASINHNLRQLIRESLGLLINSSTLFERRTIPITEQYRNNLM